MAHDPGPRFGNVTAFEGEVVGVSLDGYSVAVETRDGKRVTAQVGSPLATPGTDTDEGLFGAGIKTSPEEGSMVLVLTSSFGQHYVVHFLQPYTRDGYQGNREPVRPGDIKINTRAGSFLEALSSGLVQVGATDISKTVYLPDGASIKNICQNFLISTGMGDLSWLFDDDTKQGSFRLTSKSGSAEGSPGGILALGDNSGGNLAELRTTNGKDASVVIDNKGNVRSDSSKDITSKATGVIRQDARKIFLNSGASKGLNSFKGNFKQVIPGAPDVPGLPGLPQTPGGLTPGLPSAISKFPALAKFPTSLPTPDPKRLLDKAKSFIPPNPLPPAPPNPFSGGTSGGAGAGRSS